MVAYLGYLEKLLNSECGIYATSGDNFLDVFNIEKPPIEHVCTIRTNDTYISVEYNDKYVLREWVSKIRWYYGSMNMIRDIRKVILEKSKEDNLEPRPSDPVPIKPPEIKWVTWYPKESNKFGIKDVIFNNPATIVLWEDGTKTVVKAENEEFDPEKGLAMAIAKKALGNNYDYYDIFKKYVGKYEKKQKKG